MTENKIGPTIAPNSFGNHEKAKASVAMNPFSRIEPHHWLKYAGMVVAIDMTTGEIIGSERSEEALDAFMDAEHPQTEYAQFCFPDGEDAARGTRELADRFVASLEAAK